MLECIKNNSLLEMPPEIAEWLDPKDENSMFSSTLIERGITNWELNHCPWWLEYPLGVIPKQEKQLHARKSFETLDNLFALEFKIHYLLYKLLEFFKSFLRNIHIYLRMYTLHPIKLWSQPKKFLTTSQRLLGKARKKSLRGNLLNYNSPIMADHLLEGLPCQGHM